MTLLLIAIAVFSSCKETFFGVILCSGVPPPIVNIEAEQVIRTVVFSNGSTTSEIPLPRLPPDLQSIILSWQLQWRNRVGNGTWNVRIIPATTVSTSLPDLPAGDYEVRVRALYIGGQTPFSVPIVFESVGGQGEVHIC